MIFISISNIMTHSNIYRKLYMLWDHLGLSEDGPKFEITAKERNKTRRFIEESLHEKRAMYEPTAIKWAYALYDHCKRDESGPASLWFQNLLEQHKNSQLLVRLSRKHHSCQDIIAMLTDFSIHEDTRRSHAKSSEQLTWSEHAWFEVLSDALSEQHFDYLFGFSDGVPQSIYGDAVIDGFKDAIGADSETVSIDLELIREAWRPEFASSLRTIQHVQGHYFLYCANTILPVEPGEISDEFGWLGTQKVLVVPCWITEENRILKYEDFCPHPEDQVHVSVGVVRELPDASFEMYGVDKERAFQAKFYGRFKPFRPDGTSRGAIFARNRQKGGLEAYRFWLKRVDETKYLETLKRAKKLYEFFSKREHTLEEKYHAFYDDGTILTDVSTLLNRHEFELVHYLFLTSGLSPDDLRIKEKVRSIDRSMVIEPMRTD